MRDGQVSELTVIAPLKEGGGARLRAIFAGAGGKFAATSKVGSVHDMRFVFLDNDTKLLFASTYDGDWDSYISDFATLIPDALDIVFSEVDGWPGTRSPLVKDFIAKYQLTASAWFVAFPDATVPTIRRGQKIAAAGHCIEEHRPLGSIMRIRIKAYEMSSRYRHQMNVQTRLEPKDITELPL